MGEKNKAINFEDIKSVAKFLQKPTVKVAEALTGILASGFNDWKLSAGRLVQASIKTKLLTQLGREINCYIEKGKIKEDYLSSDLNRISFLELLKFIDEQVPDAHRFEALKSIFLYSVSKNATEKDEELAYEFMNLAKDLTSSDILVLKAAYDITNSKINPNIKTSIETTTNQASLWFSIIAAQIGHNIPELVSKRENYLIDLDLIGKRDHPHNFSRPADSFQHTSHFRLTSLGYKFCEFITKFK